MKKIVLAVMTTVVLAATALPAFANVSVRGYTRKDGTYVAPHIRTSPNGTCADNFSGCR
ncbi:hypothetical protein SAE02_77720 [Skermanella aerolata]|jgi:hypothetical protein|uniref:Uncharacterized protein n=1 Tax=Skermanella aerolata TaxID=393310 RepID=A0A512E4F6_9PROT|nr:hypothetical protein SAE02_77720 [Skermanella aerolata]